MAGSSASPALSKGDQRAAEALLTQALGEPTVVQAAEQVWDRGHVVRLHLASGRAVILKRQRRQGHHGSQGSRLFGAELAALDYLKAMPVPVAPRLLGADPEAGLLLMEDLGDGATLADSLMAAGRERVQAELIAYAEALGSLHAWSMGHRDEAAGLRARHGPGDDAGPRWRDAVQRGKAPFLAAAATLGVASDGVAAEIDQVHRMIIGTSYLGLVHGDPCPDNVRLIDGTCRIVDFETAGWGPVAYDAAYLLAPFPSCWCFARLPAEVAGRPSRPTGPGSRPPESSWDRTGRTSRQPSWPPRSSAAGKCSPKPWTRITSGERPRCGPGCWRGCVPSPAGPATVPCPGSRPPPPPWMTGSPSAGPGLKSRITRPSRSPARRSHGYPAGGSPRAVTRCAVLTQVDLRWNRWPPTSTCPSATSQASAS